jgi:RNA polymerase sigma-70 factor (ECF subfamily)
MPDYCELSSEELMPLVGAGDRDAFACLLQRHMDMVYRVAFRHVGNDAEAEDISQEVFLRVWRKADAYAPSAKFTTWLYVITANLCKNQLRSLWRRHVRLSGAVVADQDVIDSKPTPEENVLHHEKQKRLRTAIASLPENQRIALQLKRHEGLSYAEIAEILGCSVSAVESLLFRANAMLREILAR